VSKLSPPFPDRVGWYELLAPIGAGGMATVYLGVAERVGGFRKHVAVKMIHGYADGDPAHGAELVREAKLIVQIRHPNVVSVLDVGEDPFGIFLVMDYVEGDNFAGLRRAAKALGERIPDAIALKIVCDSLAGLHASHELRDERGKNLGLVHRDFSPQNILVGTDGVARLTDFGIAKVALTAGHTQTGQVKGKIGYMAPEQARGDPLDQRCDVWAAGVVAWEALAGQRLYRSEDDVSTLLKIINEDPPTLRDVRPEVSEELSSAIQGALSRALAERCPTAEVLRSRLMAAAPVASTEEVAAYVTRVVGPKLADRARRVAEIRQHRGKIAELSSVMREPVTSPPSVPATQTELDLPEATQTTNVAWRSTVASSFRKAPRRAALIGIGSGLVLGLTALALAFGLRESEEPSVTPIVPAAPEPAPPSPPAPASAPPVRAAPLRVRADRAFRALSVDGEALALEKPTQELELPVRPRPGAALVARSVDGKTATAEVGAGESQIELSFGKPAARPPAPRPTGGVPFARNPYNNR
jgi:serine/threonine-protein kinase